MEQFNIVGTQKLRCGFTTGTCAAAAASAAVMLLLTGKAPEEVSILTPKGWLVKLAVAQSEVLDGAARCGVIKDSGDDPDITNGILVLASVRRAESGVAVDGGEGVGRVTRAGLECPVGSAAINHVPRRMISSAVEDACFRCGYGGGIAVEIIIPRGAELAKKTYNPRLGIIGGISVLGTSGIVEPMSEKALVDSIKIEMDMLKAAGARGIAVTPGNYGEAFMRDSLHMDTTNVVKCSNFIGDTLDYAVVLGFESVLLVGHLGKLVKLAGGVFNTHSRYADCRMEVLAAHCAVLGAPVQLVSGIMGCVTTDEAWEKIIQAGLAEQTTNSLLTKIEYHMAARAGGTLQTGAVLFTNKYGVLGMTDGAERLINFDIQKF